MSQRRPFPIVEVAELVHEHLDVAQMMDGWDRMLGLAEDSANIIPGHDPEVMELYPAPFFRA